ncbi:MAG: hypothetical protein HZC28_13705 [Spirochaetes bacterium]|nr:hypothetical protein [Spirochaetota bacterium]
MNKRCLSVSTAMCFVLVMLAVTAMTIAEETAISGTARFDFGTFSISVNQGGSVYGPSVPDGIQFRWIEPGDNATLDGSGKKQMLVKAAGPKKASYAVVDRNVMVSYDGMLATPGGENIVSYRQRITVKPSGVIHCAYEFTMLADAVYNGISMPYVSCIIPLTAVYDKEFTITGSDDKRSLMTLKNDGAPVARFPIGKEIAVSAAPEKALRFTSTPAITVTDTRQWNGKDIQILLYGEMSEYKKQTIVKGTVKKVSFDVSLPVAAEASSLTIDGKKISGAARESAAGMSGLPDYCLSLSESANMGFADEQDGDGKGGWSDQGAENDFSGFDTARTNYLGIRFSIIDPAKNSGRSVITFKSGKISPVITTERVKLSADGAKGSYLYLLHTASRTSKGTAGSISIQMKDGREISYPVEAGRDVADWWGAGHLSNALVVVRKPSGQTTVGVYLSCFPIAETPDEIESVTLATTGKSIWIVVGATISSKKIDFTPLKMKITESERWKPVDMSNVVVVPGSALDFSDLVETGPAGKHGRVIVGPHGKLAFADSPEKPVHFFSMMPGVPVYAFLGIMKSGQENPVKGADMQEEHRNIEAYVSAVRRQGYNMVRLQNVDVFVMADAPEDYTFNEKNLERLDYMIYCLKREGIYISDDLVFHRGWLKKGSKGLAARLIVDQAERDAFEKGCRAFLLHRNPYTGMTLAEDPVLATLTFANEQDIPIEQVEPLLKSDTRPLTDAKWREFLKRRYAGDAQKMSGAWNLKENADFEHQMFQSAYMNERTERGNDAAVFLYELERNMLLWFQETIRKIGYTGLTHQYDVVAYFRNDLARNLNPVISMHGYHNHPTALDQKPGARMVQNGAIQTAANYWRKNVNARYLNRPVMNTEYNFACWGKYRHEEGLLFPAYSSFQQFSAITVHCDPVIMRMALPLANMHAGRDPIQRAGQVLAALLYARGDVSPSPHTAAVTFTDAYLFSNANLTKYMSGDQSKLSLLCGFGLQYDGEKIAGLPEYRRADLAMQPLATGAGLEITAAFANVKETAAGGSMTALVAGMKERGILTADNISAPERGIFQSDTRELTMNTKEESLSVITPRTEGAAVKAGRSAVLENVSISATTAAAVCAVSSLDGKPVSESRRLLIVYSTDALNSGFEASDDRVTLYNNGTLPVLMETGTVTFTIKNRECASMKLWALGIDGSRKEQLQAAGVSNGAVTITIDTAALKDGPTPYFELALQ